MVDPHSDRARDIVAVARDVLEQEGPEALTMRRIAHVLGIRAPSLYKHVSGKHALEVAIIIAGFEEAAAAFEAATAGAAEPLAAFATAYRAFAHAHPHLYRLMTDRPLPRAELPPGLEDRTAAPLQRATGTPARARAAWAFMHGMALLELTERFPDDGMTEQAWQAGIAAMQRQE